MMEASTRKPEKNSHYFVSEDGGTHDGIGQEQGWENSLKNVTGSPRWDFPFPQKKENLLFLEKQCTSLKAERRKEKLANKVY